MRCGFIAGVTLGALIKESLKMISDLTPREKWIFAPLVAMTLLLGVYPRLVTDITGPAVEALLAGYTDALPHEAADGLAPLGSAAASESSH